MANRTDVSAIKIFGSNPQYLISNIIRSKIYESPYWKEKCFALTCTFELPESIIDQAVNLKYVGGTYGGNRKPTRFLCLVLKLLQIQPDKDIIYEYIKNEEFIYLRALGIFYLRLIGKSLEIYQYLEPILFDYRKMRIRLQNGTFEKIYMDVFVDNCLVMSNFLDVDFPSLTKRQVLEDNNLLEKVNLDYYKELLNISSSNELFDNKVEEREDDPLGGDLDKREKRHGGDNTPSSGYGSGGSGHVEKSKRKERNAYWEKGRHKHRRRDNRRDSHDRDTDSDRSRHRSYSRERHRERTKRRENKLTEHRRHKKRTSAEGRRSYSTSESPETRRKEKKRRYDREDSDEGKRKKKERKKKKKKQEKERKKKDHSDVEENKKDDALSVERWNKIRKDLGLNPLK
ncbi:Uncharacterized protein PCOAH_00026630 [Plasmodium coatneyi]|uniref:Pre-mRNA-splicing factor 38 n=1 Tax=Plasmodium coatneyi TaxID=208452 RepID=A0A1B1DZB3_9APIC|nr:Uncharacterized protein PCOAH_00026630 [Plasmodium coatneyi]ANQ08126.1 Uncharacterized protein PCOAH_00026630 [Plasmodium coatneyi]